ncbi:MAG: DNA-directed RNA polymerase subunit delta [Bacilli bacterium]|nr:DNA-directed RNA polymerase subunit delta [Bacilli bacterium]
MKEGSMIQAACRILEENGKEMSFADLWSAVRHDLDIDDVEANARIGFFYTDLSMNGLVVALTDNVWDLRKRHTYDKVHIDVKDVYTEVEQSSGDEFDQQDDDEYNRFTGTLVEEENSEENDSEENPSKEEDGADYLGLKKEPIPEY